jgi:hypothetical protein
MKKNHNWKKINYDVHDYTKIETQNKYCIISNKSNLKKTNNYNNRNYQNYEKQDLDNYNKYSPQYIEINSIKSFYPKNFKKLESQYPNKFNNNEQYQQNTDKDYFNCENFEDNFNNYEKNGVLNENEIKCSHDEKEKNDDEDKTFEEHKEFDKQKTKKFGIRSIPHPKFKKRKGSCYISGKKLAPFNRKKEEDNNSKKDSFNSIQNNFDSAKNSISTLNTSSSSYKEKDVFNGEKKSINLNDNQTSEFNEFESANKIIKNKFDNNNTEIEKYHQINPYLENTEVLKVNVKISKDKTVIFKIRRYDDLFYTVKLFCEINSIDEKFLKPLIIKSLSTLNTIYQIFNNQISSEEISLLKDISQFEKNG